MTGQLRATPWLTIVSLLLFVMAVGAFQLDRDGLWYDEWWSLLNAGGAPFFDPPLSAVQVVERLAAEDPFQTPGYPLILAAWVSLTGGSGVTGRALSLLAALVGLALTYRAALGFTRDPDAALGAALLYAGSAWLIFFAHELRGYTLLLLFCLLFVYAYWRTTRFHQLRDYLLLALSGVIALNLHAFALAVYSALGVWHLGRLLQADGRRRWWAASVALLLPGFALLPWAILLLNVAGTLREVERVEVSPTLLAEIVGRILNAFSSASPMLLALLAVFSLRTRGAALVWRLTFGILIPTLVLYAAARIGEPRYTIALLPFLAMIGGMGAASLQRRKISLWLIFGLWALPMLLLMRDTTLERIIQNTPPQPNREIARSLTPYLTDDEGVVNYLGAGLDPIQQQLPLFRYLGREDVRFVDIDTTRTLDSFLARLDASITDLQRFWLIYSPSFEGRETALVQYRLRERGFMHCRDLVSDATLEIAAYARMNSAAPRLRFGDAVTLYNLGIGQTRDNLLVWIGIEADLPADVYSFGVHLTNAQGVLVAQHDVALPSPGAGCRLFTLPIHTLPEGTYAADLLVYDWRSGERLMGGDEQLSEWLRLADVRLVGR